jgi:hypothetical protein
MRIFFQFIICALAILAASQNINALTVAEDRADALYHAYDGGGVTVSGPSILVRKSYKEKVSAYANYYQDFVSSASIDVLTSGSKYAEERTETSAGGEYLANRALISVGYTNSDESDYKAETYSFGISQDFFGDMTTLALGYARGKDDVYRNSGDQTDFMGEAKKEKFSLGLSQILTKSWILSFSAESDVDDGFLRNPYRTYHYFAIDDLGKPSRQTKYEVYPTTRNSDALALRTMVYLPYHASIRAEGRIFNDSWGIEAQNFELRYTHALRSAFLIELKARTYSQTQADFYYDLYPEEVGNPDVYVGRDKELSTYTTHNLGIGLTYQIPYRFSFAKKHSINVYWDFIQFDYDNFRDATLSKDHPEKYNIGEEPTYSFEANVIRVFYSLSY